MREILVKVFAILVLIYAQIMAVIFAFAFIFMMAFGSDSGTSTSYYLFFLFFGVFLLGVYAIHIIAGAGLLAHRNWGRKIGIGVSIANIIIFPIGTALGVFGLIILLNTDVKKMFTKTKLKNQMKR